ncbi:hypothetical protein [Qipengyuania gelatinilytica]|uniref:Uncharacterized protein n=1 Tax=Qipengyuania gelatinilytica TaxID=2867231 RepID=A0ABX9A2T8_9SPHN|nr:hypothetical protein [Qipengyuania gelatinilytica]QZD94499.1 hypothetical protein K3136_10380 [Qipengyuania gelatinilytica]
MYEATGSGAADLTAKVEGYANDLDHEDWTYVSPFYKTAGLVAALNGTRLAEEIVGQHRNSWGGYLEWAFYTPEGWRRGPRTLNLFRFLEADEGKIIGGGNVAKCIMYEPGHDSGRILSTAPEAFREFILSPAQEAGEKPFDVEEFDWSKWTPEWVNLTIVCKVHDKVRDGKHLHTYLSRSLDMTEIEEKFEFSYKDGIVRWIFDENWSRDLNASLEAGLSRFE